MSDVLVERGDDGVAIVTLNRPDRANAWSPALEQAFYEVLSRLDGDPQVRVAVLTGAGRHFCPGVDTQRLGDIAGQPMDLSGRTGPQHTWAFRKPLIAAINGGCAGIGLVQALHCDVRFAARGARFATAFARRGLAGEYGMTWILPRIVGLESALDLLLSGRTFDADEAQSLGVVSRVVEPDQLMTEALSYARDLAANSSPASMAMIKHQVLSDLDVDYETGVRHAYRAMAHLAQLPDFREGVDSFVHKRPPRFSPLPADLSPEAVIGKPFTAVRVDPTQP